MTNQTTNNKLKVTVSLEVTLVTCVTDINAVSGQKLMILNNVCVGVLDEPSATIVHAQKEVNNHRINEKVMNFTTKPVEPVTNTPKELTDAMLIDLIEKHGPVTCMRLGDLLNIPRNHGMRLALSGKCKRMAREAAIRDLSPSRIGLYITKDAKITAKMMSQFPFLNDKKYVNYAKAEVEEAGAVT